VDGDEEEKGEQISKTAQRGGTKKNKKAAGGNSIVGDQELGGHHLCIVSILWD
jgi:hypothetical protein